MVRGVYHHGVTMQRYWSLDRAIYPSALDYLETQRCEMKYIEEMTVFTNTPYHYDYNSYHDHHSMIFQM